MFAKLTPDELVESIYEIDLGQLKDRGIQAVIADLDNTLVPWGSSEVDDSLRKWVDDINRAGIKLAIISNNSSSRVEKMSSRLGIFAISKAIKPRRGGFRSIAARFGLTPNQVAVVGDQLFTDVLGGNRTGMYTILVTPLNSREFIGTRLMRRLEYIFLRRIKNKV
jgi:hypothetical protein